MQFRIFLSLFTVKLVASFVAILSIKDEVASKDEALESLIDLVQQKGGRILQRLDIIHGLEVEFPESVIPPSDLEKSFSSIADFEEQTILHTQEDSLDSLHRVDDDFSFEKYIKDPFFDEKPKDKIPIKDDNDEKKGLRPNEFREQLQEFEEQMWLNMPSFVLNIIQRVKALNKEAGVKTEEIAQVVDGFAVWEHFATGGLILLTSLATWFITYFRFGFGWWFLALWYLSFIYSKNIERLRYKAKNQALKDYLLGIIDSDKEYVEWFNQFLARFWMNYEPELSKGLKDSIGATLDTIKAPGVDEIVLSKFTLGSQAPRIDSIKTFTNTGDEVLILDFDLSFTPYDADAVSKKEKIRRELRNLEITLLAKVAMVPLPVSLKELFINGTLRIQFTFMSGFPHIKVMDLGFVQKPRIDFVLKPLGTDLSKIAGLGSFIKDTVDNQLAQIIVNPVKMSLPIGEWMGDNTGKTEVPVGVLRVVVYEAKGLKNADVTGVSDAAAAIFIGGNEVARTAVFHNSLDPKWSEVHNIVIYQSMLGQGTQNADEFKLEIFHSSALSSSSLGVTATLSLSKWLGMIGLKDAEENVLSEKEKEKLIHEWGSPFETNGNIWKNLLLEKKRQGSVRIDLSYFPIFPAPVTPPGAVSELESIVAGVATVVVQQAKEVQMGHVCCVGNIDGLEVLRTPIRKRTVNPAWHSSHSFYCSNISKSSIMFTLLNKNSEVGHCSLNIQKAAKSTDDWYKVVGGPGKVRITVKFQPLDLIHSTVKTSHIRKVNPVGVLRVKVTEANDLYVYPADKASMGLAKNDPYCKVTLHGRVVGVTSTQEKNNQPKWHDTFYTFAYSMKEFLVLDLQDSQNLSKDRPIGKTELRLSTLFDLAEGKKVINLPPELEAIKVVRKGNFLDIWAPLFVREDSKLMETFKGSAEDLARIARGSVLASSIDQGLERKMKPKGQIHIEIEFYPTIEKDVLDFKPTPTPPIQDGVISKEVDTKKNDPSSIIDRNPLIQSIDGKAPAPSELKSASKVVADNRSGILRFRVNHVVMDSKKCKPYLEVYLGQRLLSSTCASTVATLNCDWFAASDHFVLDMCSAKVNFFLKDQSESKRSSKDPIIGFWVGDFVSAILGKGPLKLKMREYSPNWTGSFESLPDVAVLELSSSFYPVKLTNVNSQANTGILHLDILKASNLISVDSNGLSDPYVLVNLNGKNFLKTKTQKKTLNPVYEEGVQIDVHSRLKSTLVLEVKDFNQFTSHVTMGYATYSLSSIKKDTVTTIELPLEDNDASSGTITVRYLFEEAELEQIKDENEKKLQTEASALGKLGKGLTSQVTGLGSMLGSVLNAPLKEKKPHRKTITSEDQNGSQKSSTTDLVERKLNDRDAPPPNVPITEPFVASSKTAGSVTDMSSAAPDPSGLLNPGLLDESKRKRSESSSPNPVAIIPGDEVVEVHIVEAKELKAADSSGTSDPFVRVTFQGINSDNKKIHKTSVVKKTLAPVWENEKFVVPLNGLAVKLSINDKNLITDTPIGHVILDIPTLMGSKDVSDEWYRIQSGTGQLRVIMKKMHSAPHGSPITKNLALDGKEKSSRRSILSSRKALN